jgi:hypothetical protein
VQRIIKPDGETKHVIVHNQQPDQAEALLSQSVQRIYDLGLGGYDVTVSVGPSYQTKRQEAVASQMALVQAYPESFQTIGDLLVANMDWPGAKAMSTRLKKTLPPQLQDPPDGTDPAQMVIQLQGQMAGLMQQHEQLTNTVNEQNQIIQQKQVEVQGRLEGEKLRAETQLAVAEINTKAQQLSERLTFVGDMLKQFHAQAHEAGLDAQQQSHEQTMQENEPQPVNGGTQ